MKPHIFLRGDHGAAARLLPLCRKKLAEMRLLAEKFGAAVLHKTIRWTTGEMARVEWSVQPKIHIWAGGLVSYEFFTSGLIDNQVLGTPPFIDSEAWICGRGSYHRFRAAANASMPLVDMCDICAPADWPTADCGSVAGESFMRTEAYWQNQRLHEHIWWPGNRGIPFIVSASGAAPGYSGLGYTSRCNWTTGLISDSFVEDSGRDLRPAVYHGESTSPDSWAAPDLADGYWWRRACLHTVSSRTFVVMNDHQGRFHAWEMGEYPDRIVPPGAYDTVTPAYPAWANDGLGFWNFNSTGQKAVCCPYDHRQSRVDKSAVTVYKDLVTGFLRVDPAIYPSNNQLAYEDWPGLVEVSIEITADPGFGNDFSLSVEVIDAEEFEDHGRFFLGADYLVADQRLPKPLDTLVYSRFEVYAESGDFFVGGGSYCPDDLDLLARSCVVIEARDATELVRIPLHFDTAIEFGYGFPDSIDYDGDGIPDVTGTADTIAASDIYRADYLGSLWALNLRTLSWAVNHQRLVTPSPVVWKYRQQVYAYGELAEDLGDETLAIPEWSSVDYTLADTDHIELWGMAAREVYTLNPLQCFTWHPHGHWALCAPRWPPGGVSPTNVDVVSTRVNGKDFRKTHKELYNQAFGDARDYDFYLSDPDAQRGVFRTTGVWRSQ